MACVIPFAGTKDDAHVIVFPGIGRVRQIFVRTIEINVVVVIAVKKIADIERAAETDEVTDRIRMPKRNVGSMISAETGTAHGNSMSMALASGQIEDVVNDYIFVSIMRFHPIGRMNFLIVETVEIDRVRTINGDLAGIDVGSDRTDETEIFVLIIAAE